MSFHHPSCTLPMRISTMRSATAAGSPLPGVRDRGSYRSRYMEATLQGNLIKRGQQATNDNSHKPKSRILFPGTCQGWPRTRYWRRNTIQDPWSDSTSIRMGCRKQVQWIPVNRDWFLQPKKSQLTENHLYPELFIYRYLVNGFPI